jgi:hypothetical protein
MGLESRVSDIKKRGNIQTQIGPATPAHCVICGTHCGYVTEAGTGLVIAVCDDCHYTAGPIPGLQELWDDEVKDFIVSGKHR